MNQSSDLLLAKKYYNQLMSTRICHPNDREQVKEFLPLALSKYDGNTVPYIVSRIEDLKGEKRN